MLCFYAELNLQAGIEGFMTKAPLAAFGNTPSGCLNLLQLSQPCLIRSEGTSVESRQQRQDRTNRGCIQEPFKSMTTMARALL
ncbi:uncharacterized [Tachysurus ichikawai]